MTGIALPFVACCILIALMPTYAFFRGLAVGVLLASCVWLLVAVLVIRSGSLGYLWGTAGEVATAGELESSRRRRQGWAVVHGLRLMNQDIDHIAVGPRGVVVIETKWASAKPWRVAEGRLVGPLRDPLAQVRTNAFRVQHLLGVPVEAAVVVWGPGAPDVPEHCGLIDGVHLFSGTDNRRFSNWLDVIRVSPEEQQQLAERLRAESTRLGAA